jgi:hypothetical protein
MYVVPKGVREIFVGFLTNVNSTYGSWNDYWQFTGLNYGSFGLPSFVEKAHDWVNSFFIIIDIIFYTPPNSLKDSNANFKMKTMEEKKFGVHSLACSSSGVQKACWSSGMGLEWMTSEWIIHMNLHKSNNKLISA